jgi:type I restriction enzyme M protein
VPDRGDVRQNIEKALVRHYKYDPQWCEAEFRIAVGSAYKRVDIPIFPRGVPQSQENAKILVETKRVGTNPLDRKEGISQLQAYMGGMP